MLIVFGWHSKQYLVEVCDDFVEKPKTLHSLVVEVQLGVELVEVGDGSEDDAHVAVALTVQLLRGRGHLLSGGDEREKERGRKEVSLG